MTDEMSPSNRPSLGDCTSGVDKRTLEINLMRFQLADRSIAGDWNAQMLIRALTVVCQNITPDFLSISRAGDAVYR